MLSWMASDFFTTSPVLAFPVTALAIHVTVFCGVALRALLASRETLDRMSRMPLDDQEQQDG